VTRRPSSARLLKYARLAPGECVAEWSEIMKVLI
jgi:hypothetical protein